MSTTNDLVIRMRCGNGDTVRRKWGKGKGLREVWNLKRFWKSAEGSKTVLSKPKGAAPGQQKLKSPSVSWFFRKSSCAAVECSLACCVQ